MNENILKEFYIGRTVFLEPVNFKEENEENFINFFCLVEIPFKIKTLQHCGENLSVRFNYENTTSKYSKPLDYNQNLSFYLTSINSINFIIKNINHNDFITCYHEYDKKDEYKFFFDKNDNLKTYQNSYYNILISQKEKELENLKTKLSTINN